MFCFDFDFTFIDKTLYRRNLLDIQFPKDEMCLYIPFLNFKKLFWDITLLT